MLFSPRPAIAPEAYACVVFPGISTKEIAYRQPLDIPEVYKNVLLRLNEATLFRMTLFGLPAAMCQYPRMLDRSATPGRSILASFAGNGRFTTICRFGGKSPPNGRIETLGSWARISAFAGVVGCDGAARSTILVTPHKLRTPATGGRGP